MRSLVYDRHGDPADVLRVADVADPPRPGPGQVLIRVLARALHPADLASIRGTPGPDGTVAAALAPAIPGSDGLGVVEALGAHTERDGVAVGRRVSFFPGQGSWAECVLSPIEGVVPTPDQVTDTVASLTLVNPLTAQVLLDAADHTSSADDVLLATAAGSSVGGLLTTLHLRRGGSLIALVRRADAARQYHERFPDVPVVSTADPDWPALVRKAAGSRRIGIALDAVGGTLPRPLASLLADRGTLISYGMLARGSTTLESLNLIGRQLLLRGVNVGSWFARPPAQRRADQQTAVALTITRPDLFRIAGEYDLVDVTTAVAHVQRPGKNGAIIITTKPCNPARSDDQEPHGGAPRPTAPGVQAGSHRVRYDHRPAPRVHRAATLTIGSARCRRSLVAHGKLMEEHIVTILLIGATGAIGSRILDEAVARGHDVAAVARHRGTLTEGEHVRVVEADAKDVPSLARLAAGHDAVVSSLSPRAEGGAEQYLAALRAVLAAVKQAHVPYVLFVGGAASLEVAPSKSSMGRGPGCAPRAGIGPPPKTRKEYRWQSQTRRRSHSRSRSSSRT